MPNSERAVPGDSKEMTSHSFRSICVGAAASILSGCPVPLRSALLLPVVSWLETIPCRRTSVVWHRDRSLCPEDSRLVASSPSSQRNCICAYMHVSARDRGACSAACSAAKDALQFPNATPALKRSCLSEGMVDVINEPTINQAGHAFLIIGLASLTSGSTPSIPLQRTMGKRKAIREPQCIIPQHRISYCSLT